MPYDREEQRKKAMELSKPLHIDPRKTIDKAIEYALNELKEYEQHMQKSHSELSNNVICAHVDKSFMKVLDNLVTTATFLIEKDYSEEELNEMPAAVHKDVVASQQVRAELLRKIAKKYNL
ncbi:hypothetical protein TCA2_4437 [Paenibacillus sp. TCA20]|uniref:hypothetical protein n=1 Tax=Paenibacillus sp. TCA20 TaxID=1499968 RepID=UPI0004D38545|nr:hypothetical protein [Paenibacillus sp. TCA20]GAK41945.1 hypothetical protein TCA2_4437 [Paenibacillus sp. TCA20]